MERLFGILLSLQNGTPRHQEWIVGCLNGAWSNLVGDKLSAVCRPVSLTDTELKIEILDGSWAEAVRSIRPQLQEKLRTVTAGKVKTLVLSVRSTAGA
jgi:hypothetical protein